MLVVGRCRSFHVLVSTRANDRTSGIDTTIEIWKFVAVLEDMDNKSVTLRNVRRFSLFITYLKFCFSKGLLFVDNKNTDDSCLSRGKSQLNGKGTMFLANHYLVYVNNLRTFLIHLPPIASLDTYVLNGWPQTNVECFLYIGTAKYTKASPPAWKMLLFSSIIITIILSYPIIRIYIILHICLQVSETEGLAELH